jgi:hypothetical protein
VQGAGCRVQGSGFRVQGPGCKVQGSGVSHVHKRVRVEGDDARSGMRNCIEWMAFRQVATFQTSTSGVKAMIRCGGDHAM